MVKMCTAGVSRAVDTTAYISSFLSGRLCVSRVFPLFYFSGKLLDTAIISGFI